METEIPQHNEDRFSDSDPWGSENWGRHPLRETSSARQIPINEFDALMRCAPGEEPEQTLEDRQRLRDVVTGAIDLLTPEHRFIIEAIHAERLSFDELAERLGVGKTQAWRLTQQAQHELRQILNPHPTIQGRIHMYSTWNEAARAATLQLAPVGSLADRQAWTVVERKISELRTMVRTLVLDEAVMAAKLKTIGLCAASMLDNLGAWSVDEMVALLCRKQNDYGHENILSFGFIGLVVRMSDKVARYINLEHKQAQAEPRVDALVDLVGYAVIATMLEAGTFHLKLEEVAA